MIESSLPSDAQRRKEHPHEDQHDQRCLFPSQASVHKPREFIRGEISSHSPPRWLGSFAEGVGMGRNLYTKKSVAKNQLLAAAVMRFRIQMT